MTAGKGNVQLRTLEDEYDAYEKEQRRQQALSNQAFRAEYVATIPRIWTDDKRWRMFRHDLLNGTLTKQQG